MDDTWTILKSLAEKLDSLLDHPPEQTMLLQALKLGEECGEVAEAVIGVLGMNPRKGRSHTLEQVHAEACDAAVTALILIARTGGDPEAVFARHLRYLAGRSITGEATA
ncbi:MazG-like family protein [Kitasatospora sp. NPDC059577]|uniref:MazG-like family protein n=1 Tax=unclassified Kitasatospora TaxID=2633591 RepID=UPI0036B2A9E2